MSLRLRSFEHVSILAAFAAIYVIWGSTYLAVAVAVKSVPPFFLMGVRSILGGGILLGIALLRGDRISLKRDVPLAAASGLLLFVGCHGLLAFAQTRVASGVAAIMLATIPFWIVFGRLLWPGAGKRPSVRILAALLPGLLGVAFVAWPGETTGSSEWAMILVLLISAASWAFGTLLARRQESPLSAAGLSGLQLLSGGSALLVISAGTGELTDVSVAAITPGAWLGLAWLVLAGSVLTFTAYNWLLEKVEAPLVATYTFVNPIVAVVLGWLALGETLTLPMFGGFALVILSIIGVWALDNPKLAVIAGRIPGVKPGAFHRPKPVLEQRCQR